MKDTVAIVSVEGIHAAFFFDQKSVDGHGFELELASGSEDFGGGSRFEEFDEEGERESGDECGMWNVECGIFYGEAGDLVVIVMDGLDGRVGVEMGSFFLQ